MQIPDRDSASPAPHPAIKVFCSYAHSDEKLLLALVEHLSPLKRLGLISLWHDRLIAPGTDWSQAIDRHLESASLILLLISPAFFASDYCYGVEMKRALERQKVNEARIVPILLRPVTDWQRFPFAAFQVLPTGARPVTIWDNQDSAFADIATGLRHAIKEQQPGLSASAPPALLPTIWNIPFSRNSLFTGRDEILVHLHNQLQSGQPMALSQLSSHAHSQAISGLGGIGKTQIAVEYAYRYQSNYLAVLWARADSTEALTTSFAELARVLNLPEKDAQEQSEAIRAVKRWLQTHRDWLLILDNADELEPIKPFLPRTMQGHLLLTTRASATGRLAARIEVDTFSSEQGALFLLRRANLLAPGAEFAEADDDARELALSITKELGGLPLALDQAGAFLEETGCGLARYRELYKQRLFDLLRKRRGLVDDHPDPVATTWSLSFERVEQRNPAAAGLLRLFAYIAPDAIPLEIVMQGSDELGDVLGSIAKDDLALEEAIETLRAYSLVGRDPRTGMLSVHRLVQMVMQDGMGEALRKIWMKRAVRAVNKTFPDVEFSNWEICEKYVIHAKMLSGWIDRNKMFFPEIARLLYLSGYYMIERGNYSEAEPLCEQAQAICEQYLGPEHLDTAMSLNNLGTLYVGQGKYEKAEELCQRAIAIYEQHLGSDHLNVAMSLNNLAEVYRHQGKYEQGQELCERAVAIREKHLGPEHPDVAMSLNNLAEVCRRRGKYEKAEELFLRARAIYEPYLGLAHPDTIRSLNNLGTLYVDQGKYEKAEELFLRALEFREEHLGPTHPDTARSLNNLAEVYRSQEKYEQAEELFLRAMEIREKYLEPGHPDTAMSLNNLALLYVNQEKYEQAEPLYRRAMVICEEHLGPEHPYTAVNLNNLAMVYANWGKYEQAEELFQRVLAMGEQHLGPVHPDTAQYLSNLAIFYTNQGKYGPAEPSLKRALAIFEQILGAEHPNTRMARENYAILQSLIAQFSAPPPPESDPDQP